MKVVFLANFNAMLWHVISRQIKKYRTGLWIPRKQQCFDENFCLLVHAKFYSHCDVRNFSRQIKKCRSWNSQYAMFSRFFCLFAPAKKSSYEFSVSLVLTIFFLSRFYVGCDVCSNWFHGSCVGINETMAKNMTEYICDECRNARENREIYCICQQPYDETQ